MTMPDYRDHAEEMAANLMNGDERVPIHVAAGFYNVAAFKAGKSTLLPVELSEVGDVRGKTMLHLQCHFGLDTLSWAREGAVVTGAGLSPPGGEAAAGPRPAGRGRGGG